MINLLPKEKREKLIKDYRFRLLNLFLITLGFIFLIVSLILIPSVFYSEIKKEILVEKLENQKKIINTSPKPETILFVDKLDKKLNIIEESQKKFFSISEKILNPILIKRNYGIKLTKISFEDEPADKSMQKIILEGQASSREILLSFRQSLENYPDFKKVDLPISNFVKGSNINFFLNIFLTKEI